MIPHQLLAQQEHTHDTADELAACEFEHEVILGRLTRYAA